jgi:septal ring factor EnvC (AmiA/AmiB activator)
MLHTRSYLSRDCFPTLVARGNPDRLPEKTWAQFKIDFATDHRECRLTNQTAQLAGFHSANMMIKQGRDESMQDTVNAIAQLATAAATLTTTNAKLATQLEAAHALIAQLKNEIATLKTRLNLLGRDNDPSKQQTTTVIVGRMAIRWQNHTRARHAP